MKAVHILIYRSRREADAVDLGEILAAARRNNPQFGLTGALLAGPHCFAQVLEGPRAAVAEIFERLQRDDRHAEVAVLEYRPSPCRLFPQFSMALIEMAEAAGPDAGPMANAAAVMSMLNRRLREDEGAMLSAWSAATLRKTG